MNELTISNTNSFAMSRTSKAGKVSTRGILGLIIEGTAAEREELGVKLAREAWDNAVYETVIFELKRVFAGRNWDMAVAFLKLDTAKPTKAATLAVMEALVRFYPEPKGIKGKFIRLCSDLIEFEQGAAARKEARRLAYEAQQAANTVEA